MLLGRSREVAEIDCLLGDARTGHGRGMLISGEPGIGKSALLELARERAAGMRVIAAVGIEAEASLAFATLAEIAGPLIAHLDTLPERQAAAIRTALALDGEASAGGDRLAACAGLLGLLRVAADREPVLLLVDDAHWLDSASAEC
nr:ATP-binding protein [Actinomycetota bacterium]